MEKIDISIWLGTNFQLLNVNNNNIYFIIILFVFFYIRLD